MTDSIDLYPVLGPGGIQWQMSLNGGTPQGPGNYPVLNVPYGVAEDITVTIKNPGNVTFALTNEFCAQPGTSKPTKCWGPFNSKGAGTTVLTLHDGNTEKTPTTYTYVMNFKSAPQLDPIIRNGGGGPGVNKLFVAEIAAIILVVAIVAALLARRMFRSSPIEDQTKGLK